MNGATRLALVLGVAALLAAYVGASNAAIWLVIGMMFFFGCGWSLDQEEAFDVDIDEEDHYR
jgi:hypothetical protein